MKITITINERIFEIEISQQLHESIPSKITVDGKDMSIIVDKNWENEFPRHFVLDGVPHEVQIDHDEDGFPTRILIDNVPCNVKVGFLGKAKHSILKNRTFFSETKSNTIISPMPGKIVKILVKTGQKLKAGDVCMVLESMKMENELEAQTSGIVRAINVNQGELVDIEQVLLVISDEEDMFY